VCYYYSYYYYFKTAKSTGRRTVALLDILVFYLYLLYCTSNRLLCLYNDSTCTWYQVFRHWRWMTYCLLVLAVFYHFCTTRPGTLLLVLQWSEAGVGFRVRLRLTHSLREKRARAREARPIPAMIETEGNPWYFVQGTYLVEVNIQNPDWCLGNPDVSK
jgi:hypothetical protein